MHVELSDLLTCPRCGPTFGLILVPSSVRDRRVEAGVLGCANCRERYPVREGVPDLRIGGAVVEGEESSGSAEPDGDQAVRLAALLGLAEEGGTVLVAGPAAVHASVLAELVPGATILVARSAPDDVGGGAAPVAGSTGTALLVDTRLPFRSGGLRGVALTGPWGEWVGEGARLIAPAGRLVLDPAPADARERLSGTGLAVLLEESGVLVARRGG